MNSFSCFLIAATFLNSLMAGFLFSFAVVVMPGIKSLSDREFLRTFQVIDRVIQNSQTIHDYVARFNAHPRHRGCTRDYAPR